MCRQARGCVWIVALLMMLLTAGCGGDSGPSGTSGASLQVRIGELVSQYQVPGLHLGFAIDVVRAHRNGSGERDLEFFYGDLVGPDGVMPFPFNGNTPYQIASITKTFTGNMLAQLALPNPSVLNLSTNNYFPGAPSLHGIQTSLGELSSYTSGLPDGTGGAIVSHVPCGAYPAPCVTATSQINVLPNVTLAFTPGDGYLYSDLGFAVLSMALPNLLNQPSNDPEQLLTSYQDLLQTMVLNAFPLSSTHMYFPPLDDPALPFSYKDAQGGQARNGDVGFPAQLGAGGLVSTPNDMMLYLRYNMGLLKNSISNVLPLLQNPETPTNTKAGSGLSVSWFLVTLGGSTLVAVTKNGGLEGTSTYIGYTPKTNQGVVVLINGNGAGTFQNAKKLGYNILQILNGLPPKGSPGDGEDEH